ncbi:3-dehydroquinate synthase family protein, partial [Acinetobacter nosocomialis]|uniref:3-dehydroquinate synthase family protein n=1 Tax=Acinetobacter nosocomialis TaxID=106654 RepID=UPI00403A7C48
DQVGLSLFIFVVVYTIVFGSGIYYTLKLINKGPVFIDTPNMDGLVARYADLLAEAVYRSCVHKARIVANDEKEQGERALLN